MVKLVYCIKKRDDVSSKDFYDYWLNNHGPLVRSFAKTINAVRYVQSHTIMPEMNELFITTRNLAQPYDGITEVWWNSSEEMQAGYAHEAGQAAAQALLEDEAKFIDFSHSSIFMTEEHDIF
jgi:hypothetical protein